MTSPQAPGQAVPMLLLAGSWEFKPGETSLCNLHFITFFHRGICYRSQRQNEWLYEYLGWAV